MAEMTSDAMQREFWRLYQLGSYAEALDLVVRYEHLFQHREQFFNWKMCMAARTNNTTLATATGRERDDLSDLMRSWSQVLVRRGVAGLLEAAMGAGLPERLLRTTTGERTLTDLRHIGQALHTAARAEGLGPAAVTDWLRRRVEESETDYAEERSRRLETDSAAVQVVTVHASKGLEFPVVFLPVAWDRPGRDKPAVLRFHDEPGLEFQTAQLGERQRFEIFARIVDDRFIRFGHY